MQSNVISFFRGYVRLEITGKKIESLLNRAAEKRFTLWDVQFTESNKVTMFMALTDVLRLRPLLKETGCRMRVRERLGFPFWLGKLWRRKFFAAGLIVFLIGVYMLSSVVWRISVEGNDRIPEEQILKAASQVGIYPFQWKFRLGEPDELSRRLQLQLPGTAWVGVEVKGTQVHIKVVEAKVPEERQLLSPRNLVASKNAMVTNVFVEKGLPAVKPNQYVRKGDLLVSGYIGEDPNRQAVVATGVVRGLVWYTSNIEVPMVQRSKVYTGDVKDKHYLVIGNRALQLTGYGKVPFEQSETVPDRTVWHIGKWTLPVGWLHERVYAVDTAERSIDAAEARKIGLERGRTEVKAAAGRDAVIQSEKILHEKTENGKVYMEVHFEVEENIAEDQPIVP
jgi:similar to stage IV sporulation protein